MSRSVTIVGAGLCGLVAGMLLQKRGFRVRLLDKGREVGGRLASRRLYRNTEKEAVFDYGAQYFTIQDPIFSQLAKEWEANHVITKWCTRFPGQNADLPRKDRYRGVPTMRGIATHLAASLDVRRQTKVTGIHWQQHRWHIETEAGSNFTSDILIVTIPVPQALLLLDGIPIDAEIKQKLCAIHYDRCLSLLVVLDKPSRVPPPGGRRLAGEPLLWIADNHIKGISPRRVAITVHTAPGFSLSQYESDDQVIIDSLFPAFSAYLGSEPRQIVIHRWKFSRAVQCFDAPFAAIKVPGPLYIAGDAFVSSRLQGAALSGYFLANHLFTEMDDVYGCEMSTHS